MISEESRYQLHQRLEAVLGPDDANTHFEHLPPAGWADVATKHDVAGVRRDLDAVEARLNARMDQMEASLDDKIEATVHREISSFKSLFITSLLASNATVGAIVIATARLL